MKIGLNNTIIDISISITRVILKKQYNQIKTMLRLHKKVEKYSYTKKTKQNTRNIKSYKLKILIYQKLATK